jgi:hypothetical protein
MLALVAVAQLLGLTLWFSATAAPAIAAELSLTPSGQEPADWDRSAFVAIASGAVGCVIAGRRADAWGKARVAGLAMVVSAGCARSTVLVYGGSLTWLFMLAAV